MIEYVATAGCAVVATGLIYTGSRVLYRRTGYIVLNPVLVSIAVLILLLYVLDIDYGVYDRGGRLISFFLEPAVVALGVPLYLQMENLLRQKRAILTSILIGSVVGVVSGTLTAAVLGASPATMLSLAPRSVTTPIAIGVAEEIGGIPSLSAALVIASGVLGAVLGPAFLKRVGVRSRSAFGLAIGAAAHGIGTARALEEGEMEGASGGLAIALMGIATAILAPPLIAALALIWSWPR